MKSGEVGPSWSATRLIAAAAVQLDTRQLCDPLTVKFISTTLEELLCALCLYLCAWYRLYERGDAGGEELQKQQFVSM